MRPLRLKVTAFGPYAKEQVFDFRELKERNLFLITGKTGAGKTSMFDAMCIALYGESSGGGRKDSDMRSHHAEESLLTEIVFEFEIGQQIYRSHYIPSQERPARRGGGITEQKTEATLYRITAVEQADEETELLAHSVTAAKTKIKEILGCGYHQFRQIIMLAQGQFRELLEANSKVRESIFQTLFETQLYQEIEEGLKEQARDIERTYQDLENQLKGILKSGGFEAEESIENKIQSLQEEIAEQENALREIEQRLQQSEQRLEEAKTINQKLDERATSLVALNVLKDQLPQYEGKRKQLDQARKAAVVASYLENLRDRESTLKQLKAAKVALESKQAQIEADLKEAQKHKIQIDQAEPKRIEFYNQSQHLAALFPQVEELQTIHTTLESTKRQHHEAVEKDQIFSQEIETCKQSLAEIGPKIEEKKKIWKQMEVWKLERKASQHQLKIKKDMDAAKIECDEGTARKTKAQEDLAEKKGEIEEIETQLSELQQTQLKGQAAYLATSLQAGQPCPVCGSLEHPQPATSLHQIPSEKAIEIIQEKIVRAKKELDSINQRASSSQQSLGEAQGKYATLQEQLREHQAEPLSFFEAKLDTAETKLSEARLSAKELESLQYQEEDFQLKLEAKKKEQEHCQESRKRMEENLSKHTGQIEQLEKLIEQPYRDPKALRERIVESQNHYEELTRFKEEVETSFKEIREAKITVCTQLKSNTESIQQTQISAETAQNQFQQQLEQAGFLTVVAFENERMTEPAIVNLDQEIKVFDGNYGAAQQRHAQAVEAAEGLEKMELLSIEEEKKAHSLQKETILGYLGQLQEQLKTHQGMQEQIQAVKSQIQKRQKEFEEVGCISRVANGQNKHGITFQRFILASLLDEVLGVASVRLLKMTQSRYFLHRAENREDKRKAFGLDLMLTDQYTGREREVRTLSGGEGFLASLALALGLSDVVQTHSGGIQLDTLFIDEGFGTLSSEALDEVMNVLNQLSGHHRLVGIISHVPELKERIDARLEVTATEKGSTAQFII